MFNLLSEPLFAAYLCLAWYALKQLHTYSTAVRVWNRHNEISTHHIGMPTTFKGSLKAQLAQALDQFPPGNWRKFRQQSFPEAV
jgi:hypothetical protein